MRNALVILSHHIITIINMTVCACGWLYSNFNLMMRFFFDVGWSAFPLVFMYITTCISYTFTILFQMEKSFKYYFVCIRIWICYDNVSILLHNFIFVFKFKLKKKQRNKLQ